MKKLLLQNARIVNEGNIFTGSVLIDNQIIKDIFTTKVEPDEEVEIIDLEGKYLLPGIIDDQVHFREPGMEYKADIYSESKAAVAGGVTSYMDMPNNNPPILSFQALEEKYALAAGKSLANYSFYMGTSNNNLDEVLKIDPKQVCGIKVFMGSSTGNMLVDDPHSLAEIFAKAPTLVATHCEDENTIKMNMAEAKAHYGADVPMEMHPKIRSEEACFLSSSLAISLAKKYNTRLHVLHLTTAYEMKLFDKDIPLKDKKITAEVCVHHLWFSDRDYAQQGARIKCNPAIKTTNDRQALLQALNENRLDVVATDHAPHTSEEKQKKYFKAPSGIPLVQHSLPAMLELYHQEKISLPHVVDKMCHAPATVFRVHKRGFIRKGYFADLAVVDLNKTQVVKKENIYYKCQWSPFEGTSFHSSVEMTFVNGHKVYDNGRFDETPHGMRLRFER